MTRADIERGAHILFYFIAFLFIIILGATSQLFYEWSNYNQLISIFTPTSSSIFQCLKMCAYPWILFLIIFDSETTLSGLCGLIMAIVMYYSALAMWRNTVYDIITFVLSVGTGVILWAHLTQYELRNVCISCVIALSIISVLTICTFETCPGDFKI